MKKSLFLICATLFANMLLAQSQFTIDYLTYKVLNEDEVEVIDCVDSIGVVEIPATVTYDSKTYTVTAINGVNNSTGCWFAAFYNNQRLHSVKIPNTITSIGEQAFCFCTNLDSIIIPNSVTYIGERAFYSCTSLKYALIGDGVTTIDIQAFQHCSNLLELIVGNRVEYIGDWAFQYCKSLPSVTIPATTQFLGSLSFDNCDSLSEFTTLSTTPPTLDLNVFGVLEYSSGLLPDNALLKVPCGSLSAYSSSDWSSYFSDITEMCDGVSLEEVKDFEIYFYPNPTIGNITFEKTIEKIEVISQIGKILLTFNNTSAINISDLPKGVYYLRLYTNNQPILQKIIKQ